MTTRLSIHDVTYVRTQSDNYQIYRQFASATFYGVASFSITIVNKNVLTVHNFPSVQFLVLGQICTTIVIISVLKTLGVIELSALSVNTFRKIWPLPLITLLNIVFGLQGTKTLSLPMFTALRRFLLLMTMIAEYYILGVRPKLIVQLTVYVMIIGALIAAYDDLGFSAVGYVAVFLNNLFSALNGVYLKQKLDANNSIGKFDLLFCNSLFMLLPILISSYINGDLELGFNYPHWNEPIFLVQMLVSCVMGFVITLSVILCTYYNSALTTSVVGCIKNASITYVGMAFGYDYLFSWINFIGINISVAGSFIYLAKSYQFKAK